MSSVFFKMLKDRRNRQSLYSSSEYWDSKADSYDGTSVSMWPNQTLNGLYQIEQQRVIDRYLPQLAGKELIDIGCGTGRMSRWFAQRTSRVLGVDFSEGALRIAASDICPENLSYRQCSIFDLDYHADFDIAFLWGVLTVACRDITELQEALGKVHETLRPGGTLLLLEPIHRGFLHRVLDMSLSDFLNAMRAANFSVDVVEPMHFWPMRLVLSYINWPVFITSPLYHLGQVAMKTPGLTKLGDYWAIRAQAIPD